MDNQTRNKNRSIWCGKEQYMPSTATQCRQKATFSRDKCYSCWLHTVFELQNAGFQNECFLKNNFSFRRHLNDSAVEVLFRASDEWKEYFWTKRPGFLPPAMKSIQGPRKALRFPSQTNSSEYSISVQTTLKSSKIVKIYSEIHSLCTKLVTQQFE